MMNHAAELNRLIAASSSRLKNAGFSDFSNPAAAAKLRSADIFFTSSVLGMNAVSHVIEEQAIKLGKAKNARLYCGFQRFSRVLPQSDRYRSILSSGNDVYLFGVPDAELWPDPHLKAIPLEECKSSQEPDLSQNWFVVLYNPKQVSMALVTHEVPSKFRPVYSQDKLVYRNFEGFWTYDSDIIRMVVDILDDFIAVHYSN